jgi:D-amino-acid dehydrogenase
LSQQTVAIVGAGVVGASVALFLQREGHRVILLDRAGPAAGASFGNAGAIVNGSCAPTAMPGIVGEVVRMMLQPLPPLSISPAYFPRVLPWLLRFVASSRRSQVDRIAGDLHALTAGAVDAWRELTAGTRLNQILATGGWLKVYESDRSFAGTAATRALLDAVGTPYEVLDADDLRDLEPNLAPIFKHGLWQEDGLRIVNPGRLVREMVDLLVTGGGNFEQGEVLAIEPGDTSVALRLTDRTLSADRVVIAAGAWSRPLAAMLGDRIPLDTERGYHMMLPAGTEALLGRPVVNGEHSFVLSPMETGLRMTSQVELAGIDAAPDFRRIRSLLPKAKQMLPAVEASETSVWMGCRPSLPDSLPVIGRSTRSPAVLYAFGHQHLGMTLGPVTGRLVADLVAGRPARLNLAPYRPDRW